MTACRSCGAAVIWAQTASGKAIPFDAEPVPKARGLFRLVPNPDKPSAPYALAVDDEPRYVSHFATCPDAASHRKPR